MDLDENRAALAQQLIAVEQELERQILQRTGLWGLGRIRFRASSGLVTIGYIVFNSVWLIVGIVLITLHGTPRDIGIAVAAGAIFALALLWLNGGQCSFNERRLSSMLLTENLMPCLLNCI